MKGFGARLRTARNENSLTQKELAFLLKITIPTLSHWECDYQEPSFNDLLNIGNTLNVSIEYLLGLEDDFGVHTVAKTGEVYSEMEQQLITAFRQLMPETQDFVLRTAQSLKDKRDKLGAK